jgi:predicted nucleic acid-binding protein
MPEPTPRVVFDCNVFVQGIANRNSPARNALRLFFDGALSLFVSEAILREVRDVLSRPEVRRQLPGINEPVVNAFLSNREQQSLQGTAIRPGSSRQSLDYSRSKAVRGRLEAQLVRFHPARQMLFA